MPHAETRLRRSDTDRRGTRWGSGTARPASTGSVGTAWQVVEFGHHIWRGVRPTELNAVNGHLGAGPIGSKGHDNILSYLWTKQGKRQAAALSKHVAAANSPATDKSCRHLATALDAHTFTHQLVNRTWIGIPLSVGDANPSASTSPSVHRFARSRHPPDVIKYPTTRSALGTCRYKRYP